MGFFDFAKTAGRKLGMFGGKTAIEAERIAKAQMTRDQLEQRNRAIGAELVAEIERNGLSITDLSVTYADGLATLSGTAASQADKEKAILVVGNTEGIERVEDKLEVVEPEPPAVYHTVVAGDTLSAIADAEYGVMRLYDVIFEANQPMLEHPDKIYPGQVLRIPPVDPPIHTVQRGDTLGGIAKHWFGSSRRYTEIFEANRDQLASPDQIDVGQQLKIPVRHGAPA